MQSRASERLPGYGRALVDGTDGHAPQTARSSEEGKQRLDPRFIASTLSKSQPRKGS